MFTNVIFEVEDLTQPGETWRRYRNTGRVMAVCACGWYLHWEQLTLVQKHIEGHQERACPLGRKQGHPLERQQDRQEQQDASPTTMNITMPECRCHDVKGRLR